MDANSLPSLYRAADALSQKAQVAFYCFGYKGPLSVEWEDSGMDRLHGAREACQFCKNVDFERSGRAFDAAFGD